jgi:hypothetical protein
MTRFRRCFGMEEKEKQPDADAGLLTFFISTPSILSGGA